jgi:hypothetical protein
MFIATEIYNNILAAGGGTISPRTARLRTHKICLAPAWACEITICAEYTDSAPLLIRNVQCEKCYEYMLSLIPGRTFLDRCKMFSKLSIVNDESLCLVHPRMPFSISHVRGWSCCKKCHERFSQEKRQMTLLHFLVGHIKGLPSELARYIIWFAAQV